MASVKDNGTVFGSNETLEHEISKTVLHGTRIAIVQPQSKQI